ncbi:MAG: zinc-binding dehydrogenase [Alphaproteobacteria bacterium]
MNRMRAAVVRAFRDVVVEQMPKPAPEPGGLLVRTLACGICSGDVMPWYIDRKAPLVLGHEPVGLVEAAGEGAPFAIGDRVFAHHHAPCLDCDFCRRGEYVQCAAWKQPAVVPGGCAEFFAVTAKGAAHDALRLPDDLPTEAGCLIEPLGCCVKGFRRVPDEIKKGVALVLGLGPMGLLNVRLAKHFGAARVIAVDRVPFRLELARAFGADTLIDFSTSETKTAVREATDGQMADLVIAGPPDVAALTTGIDCAAPAGVVLMFSPVAPGQTYAGDPNRFYFDEIRLLPSYSCGPDDTREALGLLSTGLVDLDAFITHRFPLDRAAEAYNLVAAAGDSAKVLVTFTDA